MAATYGRRVPIPAITTVPKCPYDPEPIDGNCHNVDYRMFRGA
ncbi:MAG: hypothetical protein QOH17_4224 [Pseudonocardiales bacterium]|nr:hypothetical protein [Pseudonocardiales bacterium]